MCVGTALGQSVLLGMEIDGKVEKRYYMPISRIDDQGFLDLLIKTLNDPNDPQKGLFSKTISTAKIGQNFTLEGPFGDFYYKGEGVFQSPGAGEVKFDSVNIFTEDTGITAFYQIIETIALYPPDDLNMNLFYLVSSFVSLHRNLSGSFFILMDQN